MNSNAQLSVRNLSVAFPVRRQHPLRRPATLTALQDVSFDLAPGETFGVVGESGCGKSTLARAVLQLIRPSNGSVVWRGRELNKLRAWEMHEVRKEIQIVFQDPLDALNPRMPTGEIVAEPLWNFYPSLAKNEVRRRVSQMLADVGLAAEYLNRYPHEFSGGQCQRIGIARAMIIKPKLIVCDEPVSALDVSIQAQIINLLMGLRQTHGLSLIFISHDLSVVQRISHRILVLYLGGVVELGRAQALCTKPRHPYTRALLDAVPIPDPKQERERLQRAQPLTGELPSPLDPPSGCVFRTRCPKATKICAEVAPKLEDPGDGHVVACHNWDTGD